MLNKKLFVYIFLLFIFSTLYAADDGMEIVEIQDKNTKQQECKSTEEVWEESSINPVIIEKIKSGWGVEFNPFRFSFAALSGILSFSGGVSYFDADNNTEISIPITYNEYQVDRYYYSDSDNYNYDEIDLNIDIHYRKFLTSQVGGVYLGTFARYTYLHAKLTNDRRLATVQKYGLGVEIGYRKMGLFGGSPLYWGISMAVGKYFDDNNDIFEDESLPVYLDDQEYFIDLEILKLGYKF